MRSILLFFLRFSIKYGLNSLVNFIISFKAGSSAEPMEGTFYDLQGRRV